MIYFQETIWLNYTCSARSDTGNVATVSITRDRHRKLQNRIKIPHGIAPHLKCACCILQSHRPKWVPPVAKETQSSSRLAPLPSAPPPPFNMWTSGLSMTWNKSRWKNTTVIGANHPGPGLSVSEDVAGPVGQPERVSNEHLPDCFACTLTDSLTIMLTPRGPGGPGQRRRHKAARC